MNSNISDVKDGCYGCTACVAICPKKAIKMTESDEGFLYPQVNKELCIDCGICNLVCPCKTGWDKTVEFKYRVYAFENDNLSVLKKSTSGGFFSYIANYSNIKYICACAQTENLEVKHLVKCFPCDLNIFRGSKYVQSDLGDCYNKIAIILKNNSPILFVGTSCQVHGLKNFLRAKNVSQDNLITVDLVCHGVPSPKLYKEYLSFYEKNNDVKVKRHLFRSKKYGWGSIKGVQNYLQTLISFNEDYKSLDSNLWLNVFFSDFAIRECCYSCPYTSVNKPSDVTIGDFWGVENVIKNKLYPMGCSLVIIRNDKLYKIAQSRMFREVNTVEKNKYQQPRLNTPIKRPINRDSFWHDYRINGFKYIAKKYFGYNLKNRFFLKLYFLLINIGLVKIANKFARIIFI